MTIEEKLQQQAASAKAASRKLSALSVLEKNKALNCMADMLEAQAAEIISANELDLKNGRAKGISKPLLDRLLLDEKRIGAMADGLRQIAVLDDPIGRGLDSFVRPNGLEIHKITVPLGLVGMIYEARPNVTVDAAGLCIKSGNAVLLRGGSEAIESNKMIVALLRQALQNTKISPDAIGFVEDTDRACVEAMLHLNEYMSAIIPRGGAGLIKYVVNNSTVPVIETGTGICHAYIDKSADIEMAVRVVINAKVSRPAVCNALETLLINEEIAQEFLPPMFAALRENGVEIRGCAKVQALDSKVVPAVENDWQTEYGDLILSVKIVKDMDEAIDHINKYNTGHSETILTNDYQNARIFQQQVDAAVVYVNASTRFTDGFEFGFGAEIGISTQKLHARGPMGLSALTSVKYLVFGSGQIR